MPSHRASFVLALLFVTRLLLGNGQAATWRPDPSLGNPAQHLRLYNIGRRYGDEHFDESVGLIKRDPNKSGGHLTRESAYYAYGLLLTGDLEDRKRAERILSLVLTKQDLRKDQPSYGSYLMNYEDQWEKMVDVDLNGGQFVGMALAQIIALDRKQNYVLPEALRKQLEMSLELVVKSTMGRDIDPGYTNIAILSAAVCAAGDKLLKIPGARDFAMSKITWILSRSLPGTTLREYLAPTYYGADLNAAYQLKQFADSPELKDATDRLINFFWKDIAAGYHTPTLQLAGPHSRAYGENMLEYAAGLKYNLYLAMDGKYPIADAEADHNWDLGGLVIMANVPVDVRNEFKEPPVPWREALADPATGMTLSQYREGDFILGSINHQSLWQQQQSVVAYWPILSPVWHVGYCIDMSAQTMSNGYAHFYSVQSKSAVLALITGKPPIPQKGGLRFGFNLGAQPAPMAGGPKGAWVVRDGEVTTYIYPVTQAECAMSCTEEGNHVLVERPWTNADATEKVSALAYLVSFQLRGQPVPVVKDLRLKIADGLPTVCANVNGTGLSVGAPRR